MSTQLVKEVSKESQNATPLSASREFTKLPSDVTFYNTVNFDQKY